MPLSDLSGGLAAFNLERSPQRCPWLRINDPKVTHFELDYYRRTSDVRGAIWWHHRSLASEEYGDVWGVTFDCFGVVS